MMPGGGRRAARARVKCRIVVLELLLWEFVLNRRGRLVEAISKAAKILTR
jgi:hypothetical protein